MTESLKFKQVIRFGLDDVTSERRRQRGLVGLHVQHVLNRMSKVTDAGSFQIVKDHRDITPLFDFRIGDGVIVQRAQNDGRRLLPHSNGNADEFGNGAKIVVAELHVGRGLVHSPLPSAVAVRQGR